MLIIPRLPRRATILWIVLLLTGCGEGGNLTPAAAPSMESPQPTFTSSPTKTVPPVVTARPGLTSMPSDTATIAVPPTPSPSPIEGPLEFAVRVSKADVWDAPENENEYWSLQTQLILWEKVLVLEVKSEWSRIVAVEQPSKKDPRGYPGWVRTESLVPGWPEADQFAVVMKSITEVNSEPRGTGFLTVTLDTRLPVETTAEGWVKVRLPDGDYGWLPPEDVRLTADPAQPVPADGLFAIAETMMGVPYLWGGTTVHGWDCAGLPYRLFHAYGILMSRDADDQALEGEFVGRNDVRKGDLIFVSESSGGKITHEVMYWGNDMVMDADIKNGVMIRPISEFFVYYFWITARRFIP